MVTFEVTLPDRIDSDIDRFVEQRDYLSREQAIEELLSLGVSSYDAADECKEELANDVFTKPSTISRIQPVNEMTGSSSD